MASPQLNPEPPKKTFWAKLGSRLGDLAIEFIGTFVAIGGIAIADKLLEWWLGKDKKFFDFIPVQYVFDVGHVSLCPVDLENFCSRNWRNHDAQTTRRRQSSIATLHATERHAFIGSLRITRYGVT